MVSGARDGTRHGACARSLRLIALHEGAPAAGGRHQPRQPDVDGGDDCRLEHGVGRQVHQRDHALDCARSRVVSNIGAIEDVHAGVIENLFASDLAFLQDLYRRINQDGHTHARVACPNCSNEFAVDVAGSRLGEL